MPFNFLFSLLTILVSFSLGTFIIFNNPRNTVNISFGAFTYCVSFWVLTNFLADISKTPDQALFWAKMTMIGPAILSPVLLLFSEVFPRQVSKLKPLKWMLIFIPSLFFLIFAPTKLYIENVVFTGSGQETTLGLIYAPFTLSIFLYTGISIARLYFKFKKAKSLEKTQLAYLFYSLLVTVSAALFLSGLLPIFGFSNFISFAPTTTLILIMGVTYAVVRHRLLDIRLIVARTVAYTILLTLMAVFYIGSTVLLTNFLFKTTTSSAQLLLYSTLTLIVAFTFQPLRKFLEKTTDRVFFKQDYDSNTLLGYLTKTMAETILIDDIAHSLLKKITEDMRITRGAFVLTDAGKIFVSETQGYSKEPTFFEKDIFSIQALDKNLVFEDLEEGPAKELMRKLNVTVVLPLKTQVDHVGVLLLGEKASGEIFSQKDINVLEIFSPEASISFENAKSVEKIRRFNITLKEQVERATHELKDANEQLKELDKLKDEFLSVASHDLRTPMTAIKGYLWMAINGRAGKIENKDLKRYLDISYTSAERMITLINDLLNVSRIKAGRMQMVFEGLEIKPTMDQIFAEIMSKASEKNIDLKYVEESKFPRVIFDKQRLPEIMQNLIGNAIKFTPEKGKITVGAKLAKEKGLVEISVTDTGVGLSKEDQAKLFEKYGRIEHSYAAAKTTGGTGLGLYITKNYVEMHGGHIRIESEVGKGTAFIFTLKIADPKILTEMNKVNKEKDTAVAVPQSDSSIAREAVKTSTVGVQ